MKLRSGRILRTTTVQRRPRRVKATTVAATARRVARREVRRSKEIKRNFRSSAGSTNGTTTVINQTIGGNCNQGDDVGEREGTKLKALSVHMRLRLNNANTTIAGGTGWFRLLVVRRVQPAGGITELFKANNNATIGYTYITTGDINQITAPINELRYKVMLDKKIRILPQDLNSNGRYMCLKKYKLRLNKIISYSTTTANDTDLTPNMHCLGFLQWDNSSVVNTITYDLDTWLYYQDI